MRISKDQLARAMLKAGIDTKKKLCELTGICSNTMSAITNGKTCKMVTIIKLATALKCDPLELLEDTP